MSHPDPSHDPENELPEDVEPPMSLSRAVEIMFDPYESIRSESFDAYIERDNQRHVYE